MEQELNRKTFSELVYEPSLVSSEKSDTLAALAEKYPWSSLIKAFYAGSIAVEKVAFEKALLSAAISSPDRSVLKELLERPDHFKSLREVAEEVPAVLPEDLAALESETQPLPEPETEITEPEPTKDENLSAPETAVHPEPEIQVKDEEPATTEPQEESGTESEENAVVGDSPATDENITASVGADDEIIEETPSAAFSEPESPADVKEVEDELDAIIRENAAAPDYFTSEKGPEATEQITEDTVSKYDDDSMPYSFLWWLNKTRKEHSQNYQPYVDFRLDTTQSIKRSNVDPLSTQIIENIFHLQSPVDDLENAPRTVPFQVKGKDDDLLDKFIRDEPQIRAVASDKLDTENKARKSAEDTNDLVSETLAHIYSDQMLYHKAIDTYKKLSLKYPEKSTYFADRILDLEKKTS